MYFKNYVNLVKLNMLDIMTIEAIISYTNNRSKFYQI